MFHAIVVNFVAGDSVVVAVFGGSGKDGGPAARRRFNDLFQSLCGNHGKAAKLAGRINDRSDLGNNPSELVGENVHGVSLVQAPSASQAFTYLVQNTLESQEA